MFRHYRRIPRASVPAALALVLTGATAAHAASDPQTDYVMNLSSPSATVRSGGTTTTVISFEAEPYLDGTRVTLSVSGLPDGVTADFHPSTPLISGRSALVLHTARSTPVGTVAITVTAMTLSSDPIGTTATFGLTVAGS